MANTFITFIQKRGFYISYNPDPSGGFSFFEGDNGSDETAIVKDEKGGRKFYILNGDHRKEYENLKTFKECMEYFKSHEELKSSWSD